MLKINLLKLFIFSCMILMLSCSHTKKTIKYQPLIKNHPISVPIKTTHVKFNPENKRSPHYIKIKINEKYVIGKNYNVNPLQRSLFVNPLMRNVKFYAKVVRKNKTTEYESKPHKVTVFNNNKNRLSPSHSSLNLLIPHVQEGDQIDIVTKYDWMDIRYLPPLYLESARKTFKSKLLVDVPYGITLRFMAAHNGAPTTLVPKNKMFSYSNWIGDNNHEGLGSRYIFNYENETASKALSNRFQLYLSFETPQFDRSTLIFDSWERVSQYLYNKIDRYDVASKTINEALQKMNLNGQDSLEIVKHIISFIDTNIETFHTPLNYLQQPAHPAAITLAKRHGSPYDIAILTKAMLKAAGIPAELLAVSHGEKNPQIDNFYTPTLFHAVIVAMQSNNNTYFFDPGNTNNRLNNLNKALQGKNALIIRPQKGKLIDTPIYDN